MSRNLQTTPEPSARTWNPEHERTLPAMSDTMARAIATQDMRGIRPEFGGTNLWVYTAYEGKEALGPKRTTNISVEYTQYSDQATPSTLEFVYFDKKIEHRIGLFRLQQHSDAEYELDHRIIEPQYRRQEYGTHLLQHVEGFLQQAADVTERPVTLRMSIAQRNVMEWAIENDIMPESEAALQQVRDIIDHPEHYEFADVYGSDKIKRQDYVFTSGTESRTMNTALRFTFTKTFTPTSILAN